MFLDPQFNRLLDVATFGRLLSVYVLYFFIVWVSLSYIFRETRSRRKSDLTAALLGGLPLLVGIIASNPHLEGRIPITNSAPTIDIVETVAFVCIFGVVYLSLYVPAAIREVFTDYRFAPDPVSLLLPTFIIALGIGEVLREHIQIGSMYSSKVLLGLLLSIVLILGSFFGYLPSEFKRHFKEGRAAVTAARLAAKGAKQKAKVNPVIPAVKAVSEEAESTTALISEPAAMNSVSPPSEAISNSDGSSEISQSAIVALERALPALEVVGNSTGSVSMTTPPKSFADGVKQTEIVSNADGNVAVRTPPAAPNPVPALMVDKISTPVPTPSAAPVVVTQSRAAIPAVAITRKMQLKVKRSQRTSAFAGKVIYVLDARMDVPPEERQLIDKYHLGDLVVYDSSARIKHDEALMGHLDSKHDLSVRETFESPLASAGKSLYRFARAGVSATLAGLSLRITVYGLMKGVHVECKSMAELLGAESAIVDAAKNLRSYLDVAATFDGREEMLEF